MGKSLPSPGRLHDIASRVISSDRLRQRGPKPVPNHRHQPAPAPLSLKMESGSSSSGGGSARRRAAEEGLRTPLSEVVSECVKRWFQDTLKEAKAGDTAMQVLVGQMYSSGYGVSRDPQKGRAWITRAAKSRSSVWKVGDKHPGYNASDSDSDEEIIQV